jgi:hypothetical protein
MPLIAIRSAGRFHDLLVAKLLGGTISATGLPWRVITTVSPCSTLSRKDAALLRKLVNPVLTIGASLSVHKCTFIMRQKARKEIDLLHNPLVSLPTEIHKNGWSRIYWT